MSNCHTDPGTIIRASCDTVHPRRTQAAATAAAAAPAAAAAAATRSNLADVDGG